MLAAGWSTRWVRWSRRNAFESPVAGRPVSSRRCLAPPFRDNRTERSAVPRGLDGTDGAFRRSVRSFRLFGLLFRGTTQADPGTTARKVRLCRPSAPPITGISRSDTGWRRRPHRRSPPGRCAVGGRVALQAGPGEQGPAVAAHGHSWLRLVLPVCKPLVCLCLMCRGMAQPRIRSHPRGGRVCTRWMGSGQPATTPPGLTNSSEAGPDSSGLAARNRGPPRRADQMRVARTSAGTR